MTSLGRVDFRALKHAVSIDILKGPGKIFAEQPMLIVELKSTEATNQLARP